MRKILRERETKGTMNQRASFPAFTQVAGRLARRLVTNPNLTNITADSRVIRQLNRAPGLSGSQILGLRHRLVELEAGASAAQRGEINAVLRQIPSSSETADTFVNDLRMEAGLQDLAAGGDTGISDWFVSDVMDQYEVGTPPESLVLWQDTYKGYFRIALEAAAQIDSPQSLDVAFEAYSDALARFLNDSYLAQLGFMQDVTSAESKAHFQNMNAIKFGPVERIRNELEKTIQASPYFAELPAKYRGLKFKIALRDRIYNPANQERLTRLSALGNEYRTVSNALRVQYKDRGELTRSNVYEIMDSNAPESERKEVWQLFLAEIEKSAPRLNEIMDEMILLRNEVATTVGLPNYAVHGLHVIEYSVGLDKIKEALQAIKTTMRPLITRAVALQAKRLGKEVTELQPWDMANKTRLALPEEVEPLQPLKDKVQSADETAEDGVPAGKEILDVAQALFARIHPELAAAYSAIIAANHADILRRPTKSSGIAAACFHRHSDMDAAGLPPFLFLNHNPDADQIASVVRVLMHESGHGVQGQRLIEQHQTPGEHRLSETRTELAEITSITVEELTTAHFDVLLAEEGDQKRAYMELRQRTIYEMAFSGALIDFEIWMYEHAGHDAKTRKEKYAAIMKEYGFHPEHWSEDMTGNDWQVVPHLFTNPSYFATYLLARIVAMQFGYQYKEILKMQGAAAAETFIAEKFLPFIDAGGNLMLDEAWEKLGVAFDFTPEGLAPLVTALDKDLQEFEESLA
jgi:oligoendopeptidase F